MQTVKDVLVTTICVFVAFLADLCFLWNRVGTSDGLSVLDRLEHCCMSGHIFLGGCCSWLCVLGCNVLPHLETGHPGAPSTLIKKKRFAQGTTLSIDTRANTPAIQGVFYGPVTTQAVF